MFSKGDGVFKNFTHARESSGDGSSDHRDLSGGRVFVLRSIIRHRIRRDSNVLAVRTEGETMTARATADPLVSEGRLRAILVLVLVALTLGFYNPVAHNGFVFLDDSPYILKNPHIQNGLTWRTIKWAFSSFYIANWHPLSWLSHALDYQLFGLNPAGHHYVSLLIHTANAALVLFILEAATGLAWPSFIVAALFALHPLNVESVAWAAERKNVLSMFFCLLALLLYTKYARSGKISTYLWVVVCFALGLMSKPQIIPLPFVLLLWDYWPLQRMFGDSDGVRVVPSCPPRSLVFLLLEKVPLVVLALASAVVTMVGQRASGAVHGLTELSIATRLENTLVSYARYLADVLWPAKLAPLYPHPGNTLPAWQVGVSATALLLITTFAIHRRDRRYLLVGWLWFLATLIPTIGLIQVGEQARADRYMYLPILGILIALVWAAVDISAARNLSKSWLVPAAVVILVLGVRTRGQLAQWHDGETLWRYTLSVTRRNYMAHDNLAMVLAEQGRADEAIAEFRAAEALHSYPAPQILTLGIYEQRNGHLQGAIEQYRRALESSDDRAVRVAAWDQIASARAEGRDWDQARQAYETALEISPNDPAALVGTGLLAWHVGDRTRAITQLSHAMQVAPTAVGWLLLAGAFRQAGKAGDAAAASARARTLSRDFAQAQKITDQVAASYGITLP
jgi:protein O-mannosyl-transferase